MGKVISGSYIGNGKKKPSAQKEDDNPVFAPCPIPEIIDDEIELVGEWSPEWDKEDEELKPKDLEA